MEILNQEASLILSFDLMKYLITARKPDVILAIMEHSSSIEVKGEILDPLGRFGNFLNFDEFDDPSPLPLTMCSAFSILLHFETLLQ